MDYSKYKNFSEKEFNCSHCGKNEMQEIVLDFIQAWRDHISESVKINSGYSNMWNLLPTLLKTGVDVFNNRQESKRLESLAERNYMERVAKGEIEYQKAVMDNNNQGWKDELVLIIVVLPIIILAWSIFSGDPEAKEKLDLFFHYFNNFPEFYKWLVLGIFGSIYGLKPGMDLIKKK
jgi:hypothetical protein